jgi:hypothetical protein
MLQDLEASRPVERGAPLRSIVERKDPLGVSLPHTRAGYSCAKLPVQSRAASAPCQDILECNPTWGCRDI